MPDAEHAPPEIAHEKWAALAAAARIAAQNAYCPYSRFPVGAAVLGGSGSIYAGCNVENASYGLTICAERNAVFQAIAAGETRLLAALVFTPTPTPTAPCGACRQVLNEFGPRIPLRSVCEGSDRLDATLDRLLPHAFGPAQLDPP
jgi:cytidine deaminase